MHVRRTWCFHMVGNASFHGWDLDIDDIDHSAAEETQSNATVAGSFALYILRPLMLTILQRQEFLVCKKKNDVLRIAHWPSN